MLSVKIASIQSFRKDSYGTTKARVSPVGKAVALCQLDNFISTLCFFVCTCYVIDSVIEQGYDIDSGWNYCEAKFSITKMIEISSTTDTKAQSLIGYKNFSHFHDIKI